MKTNKVDLQEIKKILYLARAVLAGNRDKIFFWLSIVFIFGTVINAYYLINPASILKLYFGVHFNSESKAAVTYTYHILLLCYLFFSIVLVLSISFKRLLLVFFFVIFGISLFWNSFLQFSTKDVFDKYCRPGYKNFVFGKNSMYSCNYQRKDSNGVVIAYFNTDAEDKIEIYCSAKGYNFSNGREPGTSICYKFTDKDRACASGSDCQSGFCTPNDNSCIQYCEGKCESWETKNPNSYIDPAGCNGVEENYLERGKNHIPGSIECYQ